MEPLMRGRPFFLTMVLVLGLASAKAEAQPKTTTRWSKIENTPGFIGWRAQLQHIADKFGMAPVNHMCVVVATYTQVSNRDQTIWGYLYWRENNELYTLSQSRYAMDDLSLWQAPLNLKTDVVKRQKDIGSSTFLETRGWVDNILRHCDLAGTKLVVMKSHA